MSYLFNSREAGTGAPELVIVATPEPGTLEMGVTGLVMFAIWNRKRQSRGNLTRRRWLRPSGEHMRPRMWRLGVPAGQPHLPRIISFVGARPSQPAPRASNQPCHLSHPPASRRRDVARPTISPVRWRFVRVANNWGIFQFLYIFIESLTRNAPVVREFGEFASLLPAIWPGQCGANQSAMRSCMLRTRRSRRLFCCRRVRAHHALGSG